MPVLTEGEIARIEGVAAVEEAEALVAFLEAGGERRVDLSGATHIHTAVLQVLMAYQPATVALPQAEDLNALLAPILHRDGATITHAA
ncbi:hypothetical protein RGUI_2185 [Rhodovulum sp. P5]|uniref:hypothetical protein n=1 Tax=Rhodovulum sp. P5 TaxID=1564506 RepID=UPI0009C1F911|nr:hypothetical protein [Rhodovulum sp. P5]ARE40326.1 hypothetical protein RGUI_2185 [Rhodovulum sp. P5]